VSHAHHAVSLRRRTTALSCSSFALRVIEANAFPSPGTNLDGSHLINIAPQLIYKRVVVMMEEWDGIERMECNRLYRFFFVFSEFLLFGFSILGKKLNAQH